MPSAPRRLLIVSPHWPPVNAPDHQRARMSLPYYRANGWEPVVLAVRPDDVAATKEPELESTYPTDVRIVRCRALPLRWTRWLGLGNLGWRAWPSLFAAGTRLLRQERFDLVFFSNTQFLTFLLGAVWRPLTQTPFVIDIQDPWRTDFYEKSGAAPPPGGRKYLLARLLAFLLEGPVFRRAAGFISVSDRYLEDLANRYRWFPDKPQATIGFGASTDDFTAARKRAPGTQGFTRRPGEIHVVYTGIVGSVTPRALGVFFEALRRYCESHPEAARRLRFHFVGTSYAATGAGAYSVLPAARARGVGDLVTEIPHRLGHLESLSLMVEADALLLLGSTDPAYSPSKLYQYYLAGKPILGVVLHQSHLASLLAELNCSLAAEFDCGLPDDSATALIHRFLDLALQGFPPAELPVRDEVRFRQDFLAEALTRRQCELFDQVLAAEHAQKPDD